MSEQLQHPQEHLDRMQPHMAEFVTAKFDNAYTEQLHQDVENWGAQPETIPYMAHADPLELRIIAQVSETIRTEHPDMTVDEVWTEAGTTLQSLALETASANAFSDHDSVQEKRASDALCSLLCMQALDQAQNHSGSAVKQDLLEPLYTAGLGQNIKNALADLDRRAIVVKSDSNEGAYVLASSLIIGQESIATQLPEVPNKNFELKSGLDTRIEQALEKSDFVGSPEVVDAIEGYYKDHYMLASIIEKVIANEESMEEVSDQYNLGVAGSFAIDAMIKDLITTNADPTQREAVLHFAARVLKTALFQENCIGQ